MSTLHPDILNSSNIKTMVRACKKLYHEKSWNTFPEATLTRITLAELDATNSYD